MSDEATNKDTSGGSEGDAGASGAAGNENSSNGNDNNQAVGAPEKYADFTLPDDVTLNEGIMGKFSELAKGANLPQEHAQKLVDLGVEMAKGFGATIDESIEDHKKAMADSLAADKELGGENLAANQAVAIKGLEAFDTKDGALHKLFEDTGLINHPEVVRFLHKVGKTVSEDNVDDGGSGGSSQEKSIGERLYPEHKEAAA